MHVFVLLLPLLRTQFSDSVAWNPKLMCVFVLSLPVLRTQFSDSVAWNPKHNVLAYCDEVPDVRDRSLNGVVGIYAVAKS